MPLFHIVKSLLNCNSIHLLYNSIHIGFHIFKTPPPTPQNTHTYSANDIQKEINKLKQLNFCSGHVIKKFCLKMGYVQKIDMMGYFITILRSNILVSPNDVPRHQYLYHVQLEYELCRPLHRCHTSFFIILCLI